MLTIAMTVLSLSACGKEASGEEQSSAVSTEETGGGEAGQEASAAAPLQDIDAEKYVTLGDYASMKVTLTGPSVSDQDVEAFIEQKLKESGGTEGAAVMDRAVENGDTVNINFVGKLDGEAFQGGTDDSEEGTNLEIGSGSFIPGFEEGLVGAKPGETKDLTLTFPDPYDRNPDLAGKETVFTVTVNGIAPKELTEEIVPVLNKDSESIDDYKKFVRESLMEKAQTEYDNNYELNLENAIVEQLIADSTYKEIPEDMIQKYNNNIINNLTMTAQNYGMDLETYVYYAYGGIDYASFENVAAGWAEQSAQQALAFQAIANKENLNPDDETAKTRLEEEAKASGFESGEEFLGESSLEDFKEYVMFMDVMEFLKEKTEVTVE